MNRTLITMALLGLATTASAQQSPKPAGDCPRGSVSASACFPTTSETTTGSSSYSSEIDQLQTQSWTPRSERTELRSGESRQPRFADVYADFDQQFYGGYRR